MEKTIVLDKIDFRENKLPKAIGVSAREFNKCIDEIIIKWTPRIFYEKIAKKIGLSGQEIVKEMKKIVKELNSGKITEREAVVNFWKKRGRKEITLEEFVGILTLSWIYK